MNKKLLAFMVVLIIVGLCLFNALDTMKVIVIEDPSSGDSITFYPRDSKFQLGYIHSVLLTPADEYFEIASDNTLLLQKTIYESFGVGLPFEQENDADFEIVDGKFILKINRTFKSINMIISPIPQHSITVNGLKTPLYNVINTHTKSICIYAVDKPVLHLFSFDLSF